MLTRSVIAPAAIAAVAGLCATTLAQSSLGTSFTYQGRLLDGGNAPTGQYDLNFRLFDAATGGTELASANFRDNVQVVNGLFTVSLDFGNVFKGDRRFLQIEVRPGSSTGAFTPLTPRQELTGAPYATGIRLPFQSVRHETGTALLNLENTGSGRVVYLSKTDTGSANAALRVDSKASFPAIYGYGMPDGTHGGILGKSDNPGDAVRGQNTTTTGRAGVFENTNAGSTAPALYAANAGPGLAAHVDGPLRIGSPTENGRLELFRSGSNSRVMEVTTGQSGASLNLNAENGVLHTALQPDVEGQGGFFAVRRNDQATGFMVDGNTGSGNPLVSIVGQSSAAIFDMAAEGNNTVTLPTNAISAPEILDEPGVATNSSNLAFTMTGAVDTILSRTLTAPAPGYVLVMASAQVNFAHTNGTATNALFGVSDRPGVLPDTQDVGLVVPAPAPTGTYIFPVTVQGVFPVTAGSHTFYFLGDENSGAVTLNDMSLTCIYFPTSYGVTVSPLMMPPGVPVIPDELAPQARPMTAADLASERVESELWDHARLQAELLEMRAYVEEIQRRLDNNQERRVEPAKPRQDRPALDEAAPQG